jgi:thiol-disulfide isomerase/thioredoxin
MLHPLHAPEINRPGLVWFNTDRPLSLSDLSGRLVILDFWTFCCINCMHVLPTLARIEAAFSEEVVVIGVHSPKFSAERDPENLKAAIARYGITHPVIQDPWMSIWEEYAIHAWPTLVILGPDGRELGRISGEPDAKILLAGISEMVKDMQAGHLAPHLPLPTHPIKSESRSLRFPGKVKPLPEGGLAVADAGHNRILLLSPEGKEIASYGSGQMGFKDGLGEAASFNSPQGLAVTPDTIFVADTYNHAIRRIDRNSGEVSTIAGIGRRGPILSFEDKPTARMALASPWDIEFFHGRLLFANAGTHQLGSLDLLSGTARAIAGNGGEHITDGPGPHALLAQPSGLALDLRTKLLYFADSETSSIRCFDITSGEVTSLVGSGLFDFGSADGPFADALFQHPLGLCLRGDELIVADSYNHALRRLDLAGRKVETLNPTCRDELCRPLAEPAGVCALPDGRLIIADTNNHRLLEVSADGLAYKTFFGEA